MTIRQPLRRGLFALAVLLFGATLAHADDCEQNEKNSLAALPASLAMTSDAVSLCYGGVGENDPLTKEIRGLVDVTPPVPGNLARALEDLASHVKTTALYGDDTVREAYASAARNAAAGIQSGVGPGTEQVASAQWQVNSGKAKALFDVVQNLDTACGQTPPLAPRPSTPATAPTPTPTCQAAINRSKAWLRVFHLTERTLTQYFAPALNAVLKRSTARLAMWHSYRDDALPQFQWEWLVNSAFINKADNRELDDHGQPKGPIKVPTSQIILLHPGVGLEYRDKPNKASGTDESKTAPLIYLELIGRNRWSWNESTGEMIGGSGISLVTTYSNRDHDTKVGYGLLFHSRLTKNYTLGITRSGDRTNIVFNADLAEFFKDKMTYWKGVEEQSTKQ